MDDLAEARRRVELIGRHLPSSVNAARFGVRSKAPYLLLCAREALIWRTEELARCACDMLERDDLAAGIMLTRGVTESAAFVWRLNQLLEDRQKYSEADLLRRFEQMLLGSKNMIAHLDKQFPGVKDGYDQLSEFVHPNWSGVFGIFSMTDWRTHTTKFTGDARDMAAKEMAAKDIASILLAGSLDLFLRGYNSISDGLPEFVRELRASDGE
jgi:hypothetical protein